MEPRERSPSSHLPAGARSSLENQVSPLNGETPRRDDASGSLTVCLWRRTGGVFFFFNYFFCIRLTELVISGHTMRRRGSV